MEEEEDEVEQDGVEDDKVELEKVKSQVEAEPDDPMVCITHLVAGQRCDEKKQVENCKLCGETFGSKRELLAHLKVHKSKKILEENQLGLSAVEVEGETQGRQGQKRKHSSGSSTKDQASGSRSKEQGSGSRRKEQGQKRKQGESGPILCPNCGSSFNSKTLVTRHQR